MEGHKELYAESGGRKYRLRTLPDFRIFRDLAMSEDPEWSTHYSDKVLTVQSKPPGDNSTKLNIIRARRIMEKVSPQVLYDQLQDARYRETWDNNMIEGFNIVQLDPNNDIGYYSAKFPWPLSNRDFCNMRSWMEFTNGEFVIFNHSEPHSTCPEKKNFVRAKSILTGYYMQPYAGGVGTILTYVTHSDPCGSIPHAIINFAMTKGAPMILNNCEKWSELYPDFAKKTYPEDYVFPWRTPKMDWNSPYLNPQDAQRAKDNRTDPTQDHDAAAKEVPPGDATAHAAPTLVVAVGGADTTVPLVPAGPAFRYDPVFIQQYRTIMQDALHTVDRSFLREGRAPTAREYAVRLQFILEGIRATS